MSKQRLGRFTFDLTQSVPELSSSWADAYAAESTPDYPGKIYAAIQNHKLPPRLDILDLLETREASRTDILQGVLAYDVITIGNMQKIGFILARPPGLPLVMDPTKPFPSFREDDLRERLVRPLINMLNIFQTRMLSHSGISPFNLFAKNGLNQLMLGECVTLPPGMRQPALFEPIERAQSRPWAKGGYGIEDDIFAMGVTAYLLSLGQNPFASLTDDDLIRARLETGTATLMLNHAKLPSSILELVRGTCSDQGKQRWGLTELENWAGGQRVQLRSTIQSVKASRSIVFAGKEYFRARNLAAFLCTNPMETRKLVENKEILRWLQRGLGDLTLHEEIKSMLEKLPPTIQDDMLAAKLAIALDPQGPIRYKGLNVMVSGIGSALAFAFINKDAEGQQKIAEAMASDLVSYWGRLNSGGSVYLTSMIKDIEQTSSYLQVQGLGFGLERVLYELQHSAPCYSEAFERLYVLNLRQLLPALDELAADGRRPTEPLDRHSAAFLGARLGRGQENLLKSLNPTKESALRCIAILNLLASVQNRYGPDSLPRLAAWLTEGLKPALDRFHSSLLKSSLQKNLTKIATEGDLAHLKRAIDSPEVVEGDLQGFRKASQQFMTIQQQIQEIDIMLENKNTVGTVVGQRLAAAVSVMLGLAAVTAAIARAL